MNYQETLHYLYTRLPMFSRIGAAAYKADLDNTIALCAAIGQPQENFQSIHVAGTNGKGSVSHMLAAVFQSAGFKTGLYTSPHLVDFRERIRIDGEMIPEQVVIEFTQNALPLIDQIDPSFFELTVAMAFDYFSKEKVDIAIIEVGLGGRLDSTNIIHPEVSVITNIGWDHMNLLGDSLEKIAAEKAGIIKPGVPAVIGEWLPETRPVFEARAQQVNTTLYDPSERRQLMGWYWENQYLVVEIAEAHSTDHRLVHLDLPGMYQAKNLLTVMETITLMRQKGWVLPDQAIHHGLKQVKKMTGLHGRWEVLRHHPALVLDVGHNEAGIRQLIDQIEVTDHHELHIIIGMVKDKDVSMVLDLLPASAHYYFTAAAIPRAMAANELSQLATEKGLIGQEFPDVNKAIQAAVDKAGPKDLIMVCGSVFLVGEVDRSLPALHK